MMYYLQSTDPNNYGTIQFQADPNMGHPSKIKMRVKSVSTMANFIVCDETDYFVLQLDEDGEEKVCTFKSALSFDMDTIVSKLQEIVTKQFDYYNKKKGQHNVTVSLSATNQLIFTSQDKGHKVYLKDASHRANLILGAYGIELPIVHNYYLQMPKPPMLNFGYQLYLRSSMSVISGFNNIDQVDDRRKIMYRSTCYNINEFWIPGKPLICKESSPWIDAFPWELTNVTFTLVDFQDQPVRLLSPMFMVIEIKPDKPEVRETNDISDDDTESSYDYDYDDD